MLGTQTHEARHGKVWRIDKRRILCIVSRSFVEAIRRWRIGVGTRCIWRIILPINKAEIRTLIPHSDLMCLLDEVVQWDDRSIAVRQ